VKRIDFVFFERANYPAAAPVVERLLTHPRLRPLVVTGWDYKAVTGEVPPLQLPPEIPSVDIFSLAKSKGPIERVTDLPSRAIDDTLVNHALASVLTRPWWRIALEAQAKARAGLEVFIDRYRPEVAVVSDDVHYAQGRLAARVLRDRGIKVIALLAPYYQWLASAPMVGERIVDRYLVMNAATAETLRAQGVPMDSVRCIGSPYFVAEPPRERVAPLAPIRRVVYALQGSAWEERIAEDLQQALHAYPRCELVVKTHPTARARPEFLQRLSASKNVVVRSSGPVRECLEAGACLVTETSSSAVEAGYHGIPVIFVDYGGFPPRLRLDASILGSVVRNPDQLRRRLQAVLLGEGPAPPPSAWLSDNDRCVESCVKELEYLAGLPP
jgi:hypothetical protein